LAGSDIDPLGLIKRDLIAGAVEKLDRLRRLIDSDLLGVLECAAALEMGGPACGPEGVVADAERDPDGDRPPGQRATRRKPKAGLRGFDVVCFTRPSRWTARRLPIPIMLD